MLLLFSTLGIFSMPSLVLVNPFLNELWSKDYWWECSKTKGIIWCQSSLCKCPAHSLITRHYFAVLYAILFVLKLVCYLQQVQFWNSPTFLTPKLKNKTGPYHLQCKLQKDDFPGEMHGHGFPSFYPFLANWLT